MAATQVVAAVESDLGGGPLAAASRPRLRATRQRGRVESGERVDRPRAHSTERVESSCPLKLSDSPLPNGRIDLFERSNPTFRAVDSTAASARVALESRPWRALLRGRLRANGAS